MTPHSGTPGGLGTLIFSNSSRSTGAMEKGFLFDRLGVVEVPAKSLCKVESAFKARSEVGPPIPVSFCGI